MSKYFDKHYETIVDVLTIEQKTDKLNDLLEKTVAWIWGKTLDIIKFLEALKECDFTMEQAERALSIILPSISKAEAREIILGYDIYHLFDDIETPEAEWLWELADNGWADHICSNCGWKKNTDIHVSIDYKRCPNCSARMRRGVR